MTPDKHIVIPMFNSLRELFKYTAIGEDASRCNALFDVIFSVVKGLRFDDINGINNNVLEYYTELNLQHVNVSLNKLNMAIRESALYIMNEFVINDLIDHIHYLVDFDENKIVIRAYVLDTSIDYNKGVENVI